MAERINILLVEDDEDDYIITRDLLDDINADAYELEWVSDLETARKIMGANEHHLCLMDYTLGRQTGLELLSEAASLGFSAPIIMLTGQDNDELDNEASRAGAVDFLVKSNLTASRLARAIRYAVARWHMENERLERLKAESENQAKTEFLTHLSHELRTPLTAVLGYTDILLQELKQTPQAEKLGIIKRNGDHLLSLLNDVLDLSKIEAGKLDVEQDATSLLALLADVQQMLAVKASDKGLDLSFTASGKVPAKIYTDRKRLQQILLNLLNNAVKFTHNGGVNLHITCNTIEQTVSLHITDTGVGIAPHEQEKLFTPFTQLKPGIVSQETGTGLGLAISKQLTERLSGEISLTSRLGKGSCFTITLPIGMPASWVDFDLTQQTTAHYQEAPQLTGKVLVADDIPEIRALVSQIVRMTGVTVDTAEDGLQAWHKIKSPKEPYDVIFLDVQMPTMSGPQLANKLRGYGFTTPLVALTAATMKDQKDYCLSLGFNHHLSKPIDRELVWTILKDTLRAPAPKQQTQPTSGQEILLVEDDPDAADATQQLLQLLGAEVNVANTGKQALERITNSTRAVLLDINLPDINGLELAETIRKQYGESIRLITVSGQHLSKEQQQPFDQIVLKPLNLEKVQGIVQSISAK